MEVVEEALIERLMMIDWWEKPFRSHELQLQDAFPVAVNPPLDRPFSRKFNETAPEVISSIAEETWSIGAILCRTSVRISWCSAVLWW